MNLSNKPKYTSRPLLVLALIGAAPSAWANPAAQPTGSYALSCTAISVQNNTLAATCKKLDNTSQTTVLNNLDACLNIITNNGDIGNIDGNLVCIPDLPKTNPKINFPVAETTINQWVYGGQEQKLYEHAWDIWLGINQQVAVVDGTPVRAFETWATPTNMIYQTQNIPANLLAQAAKKRPKLDLSLPHQFRNMKAKANLLNAEAVAASTDGDTNIFVSVAYNPPAASHAISNKLFLESTLKQYLHEGYSEIPNFPNNAITIKPVYKIIPSNTPNGIYKFPGWPGTPTPAKTFPEQDWNSCVYVDITQNGPGGNAIDSGCQGQTANSTFYLNNFIHQKITANDANYLKTQLGLQVNAGDYAILVGMHVTSRETKRWTWQTYWWSANADAPYLPSSTAIAASRPKTLDEAAKHYAMAVAYQMVSPAQPITGGKSVGESLIAYNPHLEAGFDPSVFDQKLQRPVGNVTNRYGVQTNCMTCHNLAMYNPNTNYQINGQANRETPYGTDYYMSLTDPAFTGSLKLDFAWSVLGSMVQGQ